MVEADSRNRFSTRSSNANLHLKGSKASRITVGNTQSESLNPIIISNSTFLFNAAFGLLCSSSPIPRAGQGML